MSNKYVPPHRRRQTGSSPSNSKDAAKTAPTRTAQLIRCAYCINLDHRTDKWHKLERNARRAGLSSILHRFSALKGEDTTTTLDVQSTWESELDAHYNPKKQPAGPKQKIMTAGEIGCALSHIALWRRLLESDHPHMLILEDDCQFARDKHGRDRFAASFERAWKDLPSDWGLLYLGFSSRGERHYIVRHDETNHPSRHSSDSHYSFCHTTPDIDLYRPSYGYHTHAYMITREAATLLLSHLPITGPIDVFLADHSWFDISTYCAVIAHEGWKDKKAHRFFEGKNLIGQDRGRNFVSDVQPQQT